MGFIPIFVALLGASFLYIIYTVSNIRGQKTRVKQSKIKFKNHIELLQQLASDLHLEDLISELSARPSNDFQGFEIESQWVEQHLTKATEGAKKVELTQALKEIRELVYTLRGTIRDYNQYITESPSVWVARLWGFQKL